MSRILLLFMATLFWGSCQQRQETLSDLLMQTEQSLSADPLLTIRRADSLLKSANVPGLNFESSIRWQLIRQRAYARLGQMDAVLRAGVEIRKDAEREGDSLSMAKSLLPVRGEVSMTDQLALEPYLPGAVNTFHQQGMVYEEAVIRGLMGGIETRKGRFSEAMVFLYHARDTLEVLDSIRPLYAVYMNIGNNLSAMGNAHSSIDFYRKAREVAVRLIDSLRQASSWMNEGIAYSDMGVFDSSRAAFEEGIGFTPSQGGDLITLQLLFNLATLAEKRGDVKEAEVNYMLVRGRASAMGDPVGVSMANSGLAGIYGAAGRNDEAIRLLNTSIRSLDSLGLNHYIIDQTRKLIRLYTNADRFKEALASSEGLRTLNDSLLSVDKQTAVQELEVKYQRERQEMENKELRDEVRQRTMLIVALVTLVSILAILMVVLRQRNRYHRALVSTYERLLAEYRRQRDEVDPRQARKHPSIPVIAPAGETSKMDGEEEDVTDAVSTEEDGEVTEEEQRCYERMLDILLQEKPQLNHGFKAEDMARRLDVPARRLPQLTRKMAGQSFTQLLNRLRVDEATRIMEDTKSAQLKIDAVAVMCGFSNRQHFRRVFEQVTGVNPGFYRSRSFPDQSEMLG